MMGWGVGVNSKIIQRTKAFYSSKIWKNTLQNGFDIREKRNLTNHKRKLHVVWSLCILCSRKEGRCNIKNLTSVLHVFIVIH